MTWAGMEAGKGQGLCQPGAEAAAWVAGPRYMSPLFLAGAASAGSWDPEVARCVALETMIWAGDHLTGISGQVPAVALTLHM